MNEELIELRRSRSRHARQNRKNEEIIENILMFFASFIVVLVFVGFLTVVWLTDPAYAAPMYPEETFRMDTDEYMDLAQVLSGEAQLEPYEGQMAVVEVLANRVQADGFPDTMYDVMSEKGQFGSWKSRKTRTVTQTQIDAIEEVKASESSVFEPYIREKQAQGLFMDVEPADYVFFGTIDDYLKVGHKYMRNLIRIGKHIFATR